MHAAGLTVLMGLTAGVNGDIKFDLKYLILLVWRAEMASIISAYCLGRLTWRQRIMVGSAACSDAFPCFQGICENRQGTSTLNLDEKVFEKPGRLTGSGQLVCYLNHSGSIARRKGWATKRQCDDNDVL
jgi:hypothetical protein